MFGDIENWQADRKIVIYLGNRSIGNEYQDAERSGDFDVFETFGKAIAIMKIGGVKRNVRLGDRDRFRGIILVIIKVFDQDAFEIRIVKNRGAQGNGDQRCH